LITGYQGEIFQIPEEKNGMQDASHNRFFYQKRVT